MSLLEVYWALGAIMCVIGSLMALTDPPHHGTPDIPLFFFGAGLGGTTTLAMEILSRHLLWQ